MNIHEILFRECLATILAGVNERSRKMNIFHMLQRAAIVTEAFSTNRASLGLWTILWESLHILIQRTST